MPVRTVVDIGSAIRTARRRRKWSQDILAAKAGVTSRWLRDVEQGHPGAELGLVLKLLACLGIALELEDPQAPVDGHWHPNHVEPARPPPVIAAAEPPAALPLPAALEPIDAEPIAAAMPDASPSPEPRRDAPPPAPPSVRRVRPVPPVVTVNRLAFDQVLWTGAGLFIGMTSARAAEIAAAARAHADTLPPDSLERRSVEQALEPTG
jgi:HTH-type transcriptional regulator/antitoxin HipB